MFCSPVQKNMCACVKKWAELTAHWRLETEEFRCSSQTMASSGLAVSAVDMNRNHVLVVADPTS